MNKVVITGLGVLAASGTETSIFWDNLSHGRSGLGPITRVPLERMSTRVAGELNGFPLASHFGKEIELLDRYAQMALLCAQRALADAGLPARLDGLEALPPERIGVLTGTAMGGVETQDNGFRLLYEAGATRLHPFLIPRMMYNAATSHISMACGARGPSFAISTACSSSTHALGEAWRLVRSGAADMMLAGGSDAPLTLGVIRAWEAMRVLAPAGEDPRYACRPFSLDRAGLVLAEGAAIFVLENAEFARRRGAPVYAEFAGYGASADAGHITQPSIDGPAAALRGAMESGGISPTEVDYINAHGTGTRLNDPTETAAIRRVLGSDADRVSVSSTKSMHGHAMGASGAIELAATLMAMRHSVVPPTIGYQQPDPACDLDVTPNQARSRPIRAALSNSFAFGGLNAVLALRQYDGR